MRCGDEPSTAARSDGTPDDARMLKPSGEAEVVEMVEPEYSAGQTRTETQRRKMVGTDSSD